MKYENLSITEIEKLFDEDKVNDDLINYCNLSQSRLLNNLSNRYIYEWKNEIIQNIQNFDFDKREDINTRLSKAHLISDMNIIQNDVNIVIDGDNDFDDTQKENSKKTQYIIISTIVSFLLIIFAILLFVSNSNDVKTKNLDDATNTAEKKRKEQEKLDLKLKEEQEAKDKIDDEQKKKRESELKEKENKVKQQQQELDRKTKELEEKQKEQKELDLKLENEKKKSNQHDNKSEEESSSTIGNNSDKQLDYFKNHGNGYYYCKDKCTKWSGTKSEFISYLHKLNDLKIEKDKYKNSLFKYSNDKKEKINIENYK